MANMFSGLLDRDNPAKKLQKEVEGMELKKRALIAAVQNEIQASRQKIDSALYQIGTDMYTAHNNGTMVDDKLEAHYDSIDTLESLIAEKETKMKEIANRYDEEIGMLNAQLGLSASQVYVNQLLSSSANATMQGGNAAVSCEKCGKPYTSGEDMFCMSCGNKLS